MSADNLKQLADASSALLSPLIAIVVAYIAYQQWKTNQRREERESRQSKLSVYRRVKLLLRQIVYAEALNPDLYTDFCEACAEADFLFDDDLRGWLNELQGIAAHCMVIQETLNAATPNSDINSINAMEVELDGLTNKLRSASDVVRSKFEGYLK